MRNKFALIVMALLWCGGASSLLAQKRVEAGIFLDYLGISETKTNNFGVGGRFGYRIHRNLMLEGELAYDYGINFSSLKAQRRTLRQVCGIRLDRLFGGVGAL